MRTPTGLSLTKSNVRRVGKIKKPLCLSAAVIVDFDFYIDILSSTWSFVRNQ